MAKKVLKKKQSLATTTANAVRELAEKAKELKAKKEAMKFLVHTARKLREIDRLQKTLETYVKDSGLGKELLAEAKALSMEEIKAIEEMLNQENPHNLIVNESVFSYSDLYNTAISLNAHYQS